MDATYSPLFSCVLCLKIFHCNFITWATGLDFYIVFSCTKVKFHRIRFFIPSLFPSFLVPETFAAASLSQRDISPLISGRKIEVIFSPFGLRRRSIKICRMKKKLHSDSDHRVGVGVGSDRHRLK